MDANDAGGRNSEHCTLILTEGDSAKSLVVAGLSVGGRDKFGVFPLRFVASFRCNLCMFPWKFYLRVNSTVVRDMSQRTPAYWGPSYHALLDV